MEGSATAAATGKFKPNEGDWICPEQKYTL